MSKSFVNAILWAVLLGLTACGNNSKSIRAGTAETEDSAIALSGTYNVGIQCVDDAAQAKLEDSESVATFHPDGTYSINYKLLGKCTKGCTYQSRGTYKLTASSLVLKQSYNLDVERNSESRSVLTNTMLIQGIDKERNNIVAIEESKSNMCGGQAILGFNKVK